MRLFNPLSAYQSVHSLGDQPPLPGRTLSIILAIFLFAMLPASTTFAGPTNMETYEVISGGLVEIKNGAYIEGSTKFDGLQPDYKIDLESPVILRQLRKAQEIGKLHGNIWMKVNAVLELTQRTLLQRQYRGARYIQLLEKYRQSEKDIPLSEYLRISAGVCRENALLAHFLLKAAGIPNYYAYARTYQIRRVLRDIEEDHAFNVIEIDGEQWAVDAYGPFNHQKLEHLLRPEGVIVGSPDRPHSTYHQIQTGIIRINNYPKVLNPIDGQSLVCEDLLLTRKNVVKRSIQRLWKRVFVKSPKGA